MFYKKFMENYVFTENKGLINIALKIIKKIHTSFDTLENLTTSKDVIVYDKVCLFYVIMDLEVSMDCVIIGFYFPIINHYHCITLDKSLDQKEFNERRLDLIDFIGYLLNPIFLYKSNLYKDFSNLEDEDLIELRKASQYKQMYVHEPNLLAGFLSLKKDSPLKQRLNQKLKKLIGPMLITFNGENYDFFILSSILFYNSKNKKKYENFEDIERSEINEDVSLCLEKVYNKNLEIFERKSNVFVGKEEKREYPFSLLFTKNLLHFDVFKFVQRKSFLQNLFINKNIIFFKELFQDSNLESKILPIERLALSKPIDYAKFEDLNFIKVYNFNDCFYTYKILGFIKQIKEHFDSRFMFFENFDFKEINFCQSLNIPDSNLGVKYISEYFEGNFISLTKQQGNKEVISFNDLIILYNYSYSKAIFEEQFNNVNYLDLKKEDYKDRIIKVCNIEVNLGFGGLHSKNFIKSQNESFLQEDEEATSKSKIFVSDENTVLFDLDVASFYVVIILKIFEKFNDNEKYLFFKGLYDLRLKLKKENNPLQLVYKIITLSVTGQFNLKQSNVFDPLTYYSMTANGQLMILDILMSLEKKNLIKELIGVNTDGFTLSVEKNKVNDLKKTIQEYAESFGIDFDTFDEINSLIIFNVNKYIFNYKNPQKQSKLKGFGEGEFEILQILLKNLLSQVNPEKIDINSVWESFNKTFDSESKESLLNPVFLSYSSYGGEKKLFYFSSEPDSFAGINLSNTRSFYTKDDVYPIKELNPQKEIYKNNISNIQDIIEKTKISKSSYFKLFLNLLKKVPQITESLNFERFSQDNKKDFIATLKNDYPAFKTASYLNDKYNAFIIPKRENKRTIQGSKMDADIPNNKMDDFSEIRKIVSEHNQKFLQGNFLGKIFFDTAAIAIGLKSSFPNLVVLDVDHPEIFFQKDEVATKILSRGIYSLLKNAFLQNCLIFSTPFEEQVYGFKIIFSLEFENDDRKVTFDSFRKRFNELFEKKQLPFKIENTASICGLNLTPWELEPFYKNVLENNDVFKLTIKEFYDLILDTTQIESDNLIELREILLNPQNLSPEVFDHFYEILKQKASFKPKSLQIQSYEPSVLSNTKSIIQENFNEKEKILQQTLIKKYLPEKQEAFFEDQTILQDVKQLKAILNQLSYSIKKIQKDYRETSNFNLENITKQEDLNLYLQYKENFKDYFEKKIKDDIEKCVIRYEQKDNLRDFFSGKFIWSEYFVNYVNNFLNFLHETHGLFFKLKKIKYFSSKGNDNEKEEIEISFNHLEHLSVDLIPKGVDLISLDFGSFCVRKPEDKNPDIVLLRIENFKVLIHCLHQSCIDSQMYKRLGNEMSNSFLTLFLLKDPRPFEEKNESLLNFFLGDINLNEIDLES